MEGAEIKRFSKTLSLLSLLVLTYSFQATSLSQWGPLPGTVEIFCRDCDPNDEQHPATRTWLDSGANWLTNNGYEAGYVNIVNTNNMSSATYYWSGSNLGNYDWLFGTVGNCPFLQVCNDMPADVF